MSFFILARNPKPNGDYLVHNLNSCLYVPEVSEQIGLGEHETCVGAVSAAKILFPEVQVNGCPRCAKKCHIS